MSTVYKMRPVKLIGRKIRQLRKARNLTQTELSARIGIQQSDLSRMEKGEYRVSLDTLFRILSEFEMSFGEFFDEMARESLSDRDLRLLHELQTLDEGSRTEVESLIAQRIESASSPRGAIRDLNWPARSPERA
ncbi:MAG TPA: helix-turn-helix transcriptional regulator [Thermoanaerobaculia bacterium]|nr:helix-turn-helix transcriptional regulator [Thermoanaerobaculia bacterium]